MIKYVTLQQPKIYGFKSALNKKTVHQHPITGLLLLQYIVLCTHTFFDNKVP